jgi:hypothetical protein
MAHLESVIYVGSLATLQENVPKTWPPSNIKIWVLVWVLTTSDLLRDKEGEDAFQTLGRCIISLEDMHLPDEVDQEEEEETN